MNYLRVRMSWIMLFAAIFSTACKSTKNESVNEHPNFIFFIADDMTYDQFNCLSSGKRKNLTPTLDRIAKEGVIMMNQYFSSTVCSPSRYSCLTGKYASRASNPEFKNNMAENENQAVVQWNTKIVEGEQNLAALLNDLGYYTGASGKNHVIQVPGWVKVSLTADTADPAVIQQLVSNNEKLKKAYHGVGFDYADGLWYDNPDYNGPLSLAKHNMDWSAQYALEFLDNAKDSTFFLYFASTIPHGPTEADRAWNADRRIIPFGKLDEAPNVLPGKETIPQRLIEAGLATPGNIPDSKANILWLDDVLSALMDKLEEIGQLDNTILVFFSDHGQDAKGTVYEDGTRSPSIIWKAGGFNTDHENPTIVQNIDFAPTIYDLAGGNPDEIEFDGKSFAKALNGENLSIHQSL